VVWAVRFDVATTNKSEVMTTRPMNQDFIKNLVTSP
jgi:hypothetical protein